MRARQQGFNLWELMMALVVAGIVLGIGVPSFRDFQRTNAMAAAANELLTGVLLARSEAVKRQTSVTLCLTPDPSEPVPQCALAGSAGAFVVFVDEDRDTQASAPDAVVLRVSAPRGTIRMSADNDYLTYGPSGFPRQGEGRDEPPVERILFCDERGADASTGGTSAARVIAIEPTGRAAVRQSVDVVTAAVAALGADCKG